MRSTMGILAPNCGDPPRPIVCTMRRGRPQILRPDSGAFQFGISATFDKVDDNVLQPDTTEDGQGNVYVGSGTVPSPGVGFQRPAGPVRTMKIWILAKYSGTSGSITELKYVLGAGSPVAVAVSFTLTTSYAWYSVTVNLNVQAVTALTMEPSDITVGGFSNVSIGAMYIEVNPE